VLVVAVSLAPLALVLMVFVGVPGLFMVRVAWKRHKEGR